MFKNFIVQYIVAGSTKDQTKIGELAVHKKCVIRRRVAENPNCAVAVLDHLSRDQDVDVRIATALNRSVSATTLERLSSDPQPDARFAIASDSGTSLSRLMVLIGDENPYVRTGQPKHRIAMSTEKMSLSLMPTLSNR